jgi:hypothetical protein
MRLNFQHNNGLQMSQSTRFARIAMMPPLLFSSLHVHGLPTHYTPPRDDDDDDDDVCSADDEEVR